MQGGPIPITPSVIFLLGETQPFFSNACAGTMVGRAILPRNGVPRQSFVYLGNSRTQREMSLDTEPTHPSGACLVELLNRFLYGDLMKHLA